MPDPSLSSAGLFDPANPAPLVERLVHAVNADSDLQRRGAACNADCLLGLGEAVFHLEIVNGRIVAAQSGPVLMRSWQFAIRASADVWAKFWQPIPEPGWHDIFALTKRGHAVIEGDFKPLLTNLQYVKDVLATPRRFAGQVS